jgi:hypothetical protein
MVYSYNYHNSGHYPLSCLLIKTHLNSIGLSVPHRKHVTSPLRAQQVNAIYRFVTMYINITITLLDIIHRPVFYLIQLNSIGLSVPHRKHVTSPLQAQQVNAIYRFVTMVY